eukprot:257493-Chlamydomonas_euryale.AAC.14
MLPCDQTYQSGMLAKGQPDGLTPRHRRGRRVATLGSWQRVGVHTPEGLGGNEGAWSCPLPCTPMHGRDGTPHTASCNKRARIIATETRARRFSPPAGTAAPLALRTPSCGHPACRPCASGGSAETTSTAPRKGGGRAPAWQIRLGAPARLVPVPRSRCRAAACQPASQRSPPGRRGPAPPSSRPSHRRPSSNMGGCCSGRLLHRDAAAGATKYAAPAESAVAQAGRAAAGPTRLGEGATRRASAYAERSRLHRGASTPPKRRRRQRCAPRAARRSGGDNPDGGFLHACMHAVHVWTLYKRGGAVGCAHTDWLGLTWPGVVWHQARSAVVYVLRCGCCRCEWHSLDFGWLQRSMKGNQELNPEPYAATWRGGASHGGA